MPPYCTLSNGWFYITVNFTLISKKKKKYCRISSWQNKTSAANSSHSAGTSHGPPGPSSPLPQIWFTDSRVHSTSLNDQLQRSNCPSAFPFPSSIPGCHLPSWKTPFPQWVKHLFWERARSAGKQPPNRETFSHGGIQFARGGSWNHCPGAPALRKRHVKGWQGCCPGFLGPAEGLRSPCPCLCLPEKTWMSGINHTLARFLKEETHQQTDSQPVFLENCGWRKG